jgi:hypothetical protein
LVRLGARARIPPGGTLVSADHVSWGYCPIAAATNNFWGSYKEKLAIRSVLGATCRKIRIG